MAFFRVEKRFSDKSGVNQTLLRSFFSYNKISNIFQFFESSTYHSCEQKYNKMASLDVSKCFDSIYTHSIAWSVFGKEKVKHSLASSSSKFLNGSFPDRFDKLMQQQNYNETNGILIGPELSRIFAELILQKVDFEVREYLNKLGYEQGKHYQIFRYVDDFFVFFNDDKCYQDIVQTLEVHLNEYKLGLNTEKEKVYKKPIITEITIAKRKISRLISEIINLDVEESLEESGPNKDKIRTGSIYINSSQLITDFKTIIKESGVEYKDILNYSISIIERKSIKIIKKYRNLDNTADIYGNLILSLNSIVDFCFFIYSVSPRVNSTIKLSRVLYSIITFSRSKFVYYDDMHQIFKRIFDHIYFVINKNERTNHTQVETLYLLTVLSELGKNYWLEEEMLAEYFGANKDDKDEFIFKNELNYFSITVLFFYMKDKLRYNNLRNSLIKFSINKFKTSKHPIDKSSESALLFLDLIACPYIKRSSKIELLKLSGVNSSKYLDVIGYKRYWFTKWDSFDFGKELDAKASVEVY